MGAVAYGFSSIFYAATAIYALVEQTVDCSQLVKKMGLIYTLHGGLMVGESFLLGGASISARYFAAYMGGLMIAGSLTHCLISPRPWQCYSHHWLYQHGALFTLKFARRR